MKKKNAPLLLVDDFAETSAKNTFAEKAVLTCRYALLASAVLLLSACAAADKVKERFSGADEKAAVEDNLSSDNVAVPAPMNPRQKLLVDIQESLDELGYAPGRTDGKIDAQTEAAIQDFQLDNNMRVNGRPSADLLQKLERAIRLR